jgi:hypothetical protein
VYDREGSYSLDFTQFTDIKIKEDEPLNRQLNDALKKMVYSKRKSARQFYQRENSDYDAVVPDFGD